MSNMATSHMSQPHLHHNIIYCVFVTAISPLHWHIKVCTKSHMFSTSCIFYVLAEAFPTGIGYCSLGLKNRIMWLPGWESSLRSTISPVDSIRELWRREIDRRTDTSWQQRPHLCIASHGNKYDIQIWIVIQLRFVVCSCGQFFANRTCL